MPGETEETDRESMRAILSHGYGPSGVLRPGNAPKPTPGSGEVLVRVRASAVTAADTMMRRGTPLFARPFLGLFRPRARIPGTALAGDIVAVGEGVTRFAVGDRVSGETGVQFGAHAEFVCVPEDGVLLPLPDGMTYEQVAPLCDGPLTSLNFLRNVTTLAPGDRVLINGAAGSLGTAAVQIARIIGAEITAVCGADNEELVRSLGAEQVIDYTREDFTAGKQSWDVIYDAVGRSSFPRCRRVLAEEGVYLSPVLSLSLLAQMARTSRFGRQRAKFDATGLQPPEKLRAMLEEILQWMAEGEMKSVTDRVVSLEEIPAAHRHVDTGHKRGNVVVSVAE